MARTTCHETERNPLKKNQLFLVLLIVAQAGCAGFFIWDVVHDYLSEVTPFYLSWHLMVEAVATLLLVAAVALEGRMLIDLTRRNEAIERNMRVATGALGDVIEDYFNEWGLTPAERDVAMFAIKGMSNAEIAALRDSSEGTIKAHLNGVFRKAGVSGRNQLVSLLIEDLMSQPLVSDGK